MVGTSLEEIRSSGESLALFGLGLLMVYLTLSAECESFVLPFIILLSVPMALLGALIAQPARGLLNDVYCQIAMVMLIGLASKNGIRIVEFAEQLRDKRLSINEAAVQAAKIPFAPHPDDRLPSSLSFCPRFSPLVQDQPVETPSDQPYLEA